MRTNFIIDFEFNGLPAYKFKPEIVQVKIMNLETKDFLVTNFLSKKGITAGAKIKKGLTVMPWGEFSGTPIKEYCRANRRRADGYRYNNSDDLASALTFYCSEIDEEERAYWEQFPDFI